MAIMSPGISVIMLEMKLTISEFKYQVICSS